MSEIMTEEESQALQDLLAVAENFELLNRQLRDSLPPEKFDPESDEKG